MKRLPIGVTNFKKLIEEDYYYVDKTLLIKELLDKGNAVTLLPRPRRFGKTINLSMLNYFFSNTEQGGHLFTSTAIAQHQDTMAYQGKYPVIFISFKDVKVSNYTKAFQHIGELLAKEFNRYKEILLPILSAHEDAVYNAILAEKASEVQLETSLKYLTDLLCRHYQKKVIILLDEYDAPIQAAFTHGYYKELVEFIRNLFSAALKDNNNLEMGVLTGILRTAKEGIFSGLNNLKVYTVLQEPSSTYFGFTQQEVDACLADYNLTDKTQAIKEWYNGYRFAGTTIYNPWSILNCVQEHGELVPYWSHTSDNALIKKLIIHAPMHLQQQLEQILKNEPVEQPIEDAFIYPTIESNETALWSLLVFSGYLTTLQRKRVGDEYRYDLAIPNKEVRTIYKKFLEEALSQPLKTTTVRALYEALITGDGSSFEQIIQEYILNSISMFDLPKNEAEKSYHLFVLGLLVTLSDTYDVVSNRESGYGRYDIMLVPKDLTKRAIIIEFKRVLPKETLEIAATKALEQIHAKQYAQELKNRGIHTITAFGIAFKGKEVLLKQEMVL
jgi:predicted AAA-ATPase/PD-(D/E)XK nuclease superfamily protein